VIQWVISSGRPDAAIDGLGFHPMTGGPSGIYDSPPLQWTRLVVVNELPVFGPSHSAGAGPASQEACSPGFGGPAFLSSSLC
jgi:hypothetical protein